MIGQEYCTFLEWENFKNSKRKGKFHSIGTSKTKSESYIVEFCRYKPFLRVSHLGKDTLTNIVKDTCTVSVLNQQAIFVAASCRRQSHSCHQS